MNIDLLHAQAEVLITRLAATNLVFCLSLTFLSPYCFHGRKTKMFSDVKLPCSSFHFSWQCFTESIWNQTVRSIWDTKTLLSKAMQNWQNHHTSLLVKIKSVLALQINLNPSLVALRFWSARAGLGSTVTPSSSALPASLCSPLLRLPPAARVSGQMAAGRGICRRRRLVPPHRAETGVICRTISIFMNRVRVQTASSSIRLWLGRLQPQ